MRASPDPSVAGPRVAGMVAWALLAGCTGEVNVYLLDSSQELVGGELGLQEFELPLDHLEALRDGAWEALARGPDPYNLLDFSGEPTVVDLLALREERVRITHDEVPVGEITALRLFLTPGELYSLTTVDGVSHPLAAPPAEGWEVAVTLEVTTEAAAERTLDLHVRDCIVQGADGVWSFVPELRSVD